MTTSMGFYDRWSVLADKDGLSLNCHECGHPGSAHTRLHCFWNVDTTGVRVTLCSCNNELRWCENVIFPGRPCIKPLFHSGAHSDGKGRSWADDLDDDVSLVSHAKLCVGELAEWLGVDIPDEMSYRPGLDRATVATSEEFFWRRR